MSKLSTTAFCVLFAASIGCSSIASANLLINGGFDSEPNYGSGVVNGVGFSALTGSQIPGWIIEPGRAVTIHDTSTYPFISGPFSVNTDGEGFGGHNANLYQDLTSVAGQQYQFQFDWAGWISTSAHLDVSITDTVTSQVLYHGNFAWAVGSHHVSSAFIGTGNTLRLRVQESPESATNDNGFIVDNFAIDASVTAAPAAVIPTLSLPMLGLLGVLLAFLALVARRRNSHEWSGLTFFCEGQALHTLWRRSSSLRARIR